MSHSTHHIPGCVFNPKVFRFSPSEAPLQYSSPNTSETINVPSFDMELSIHKCSSLMRREVNAVFPDSKGFQDIYAIVTWQSCSYELIDYTALIEFDKDVKLEQFIAFGTKLLNTIEEKQGYPLLFGDLVEPSTGHPYLTTVSPSIYPEVDGCASFLRYRREQVGQCCVIRHPVYGICCYPATMFVVGDLSTIIDAIHTLGEPIQSDAGSSASTSASHDGSTLQHSSHNEQKGRSSSQDSTNQDDGDSSFQDVECSSSALMPQTAIALHGV